MNIPLSISKGDAKQKVISWLKKFMVTVHHFRLTQLAVNKAKNFCQNTTCRWKYKRIINNNRIF